MWTVYCHEFPNGKRYIGLTSLPLEKRWGANGSGYMNGSQPLMARAICKYGWSSVRHSVLVSGIKTLEEANEAEHRLILEYRTCERAYGYNLRSGGDSAGSHGEETRRKISASRKDFYRRHPEARTGTSGRRHTEEQRRKCSYSVKRFYEGHPEARAEKSRLLTGKKRPFAPHPRQRKAVVCVETGIKYESVRAAAEASGASQSSISHCLRGDFRSAGGFDWRYS